MLLFLMLGLAIVPEGFWESKGYGYVLAVDGKRIQIFDVSKAGCVESQKYTREEFQGLYGSFVDGFGLDRYPTRDGLERLTALPEACRKPLRSKDAKVNLEVFAATMQEQYPFFAARKTNWAASVEAAKARVQKGEDLFEVMTGMVKPIGDGHLTIDAGKRSFDGETVDWKALRTSLRETLQGAKTPLVEAAKLDGNRRVLYGKLKGEVGYLAVLAEGGWAEGLTEESPVVGHVKPVKEVMNKMLRELRGVKGMVLDLRVNSGGYDAVAMEIASRFVKQKQVAYRKHATGGAAYEVMLEPSGEERFEGPVVVLIGRDTVSAGETLALVMGAVPGVTLVGQPTRGELSDAIPKKLPNGWGFTVSIESVLTAGGELVEAKGVQPTVLREKGDWVADIEVAVAKILQR
jgi:hypothetical protein